MIETVFSKQHKMTDKEWQQICGLDRERYLSVVDEQSARLDLAFLYQLRGDSERTANYLNGLSHLVVNDFWRTVTHP